MHMRAGESLEVKSVCCGIERVGGNLVLIGVSGSYGSLFVGVVTTLVDNS